MSKIEEIVQKIIREQELIIGPLAWVEAGKVKGLRIIDKKAGTVSIEGPNGSLVIDGLVGEYEHMFGRASREVCRDAVASLLADLPAEEVPMSLR